MSIWAIGDIQGCYDPLRRLLDQCRFDPDRDRLWLVGDLVNRGPQSLETLRFVRDLGEAATVVLGNHDLYLLMVAAQAVPKRARDDTLEAVLQAPDRDELLDWLRQQPLMHLEEVAGTPYGLLHAGLLPAWTAQTARALAREVEDCLGGDNPEGFLRALWGDAPAGWSDDLTGWARLRVIVNAFTRLRFCTPEGVMEFRTKGAVDRPPPGHVPWFAIPHRRSRDAVLVTGHWSALGLRLETDFLALDSGCLWGGALTALRLPEREVQQVTCTACAEGGD